MKTGNDKKIDFLIESALKNGASCATVSDGHVIVIKKDTLKSLLDDKNTSEIVTIFVQKTVSPSQIN